MRTSSLAQPSQVHESETEVAGDAASKTSCSKLRDDVVAPGHATDIDWDNNEDDESEGNDAPLQGFQALEDDVEDHDSGRHNDDLQEDLDKHSSADPIVDWEPDWTEADPATGGS